MGETTERPEAIEVGTAKLVGTAADSIVREVSLLLTYECAYRAVSRAVNPYGDGRATVMNQSRNRVAESLGGTVGESARLLGLSRLREAGRCWVALPGEVERWWRQRNRMTLVQDGDD